MVYKVYITCQIGYNEYESSLYASYTDGEQAGETVCYLRSQGLNASVEAFKDETDLDDFKY